MRSWILGRRWEGRLWSASWELSTTADKMGGQYRGELINLTRGKLPFESFWGWLEILRSFPKEMKTTKF